MSRIEQVHQALMVLSVVMCLSCTPAVAPQPLGDDASADGGADAQDALFDASQSVCEKYCANLEAKGCKEAFASDGGAPCVPLCEKTRLEKKFDMKWACVSVAGSVDAIRACGTVRCK